MSARCSTKHNWELLHNTIHAGVHESGSIPQSGAEENLDPATAASYAPMKPDPTLDFLIHFFHHKCERKETDWCRCAVLVFLCVLCVLCGFALLFSAPSPVDS